MDVENQKEWSATRSDHLESADFSSMNAVKSEPDVEIFALHTTIRSAIPSMALVPISMLDLFGDLPNCAVDPTSRRLGIC
jgi:hypothetical protein